MRFQRGDRVDHYTLIEPLGEGGQGAVWKVLDPRDGGVVRALKLIVLADTGASGFARARREAQILATAQHPSLVAGHGLFEDPRAGLVGLLMDLVPGESLADALAGGRIPRAHGLAALAQLADALAYIHEAGLTHRDLKPDNVLLTEGFHEAPHRAGTVKLVDFGIAAPAGNAYRLTGTGLVIGTLRYLAPELVDPASFGHADGHARDLFAFGVMAHEILCGGHPTGLGPEATMIDYARAYKAAEAGRIAWPPAGLAGISSAAIAACLALRPEQRPADGAALVALLRSRRRAEPAPASSAAGPTTPHREAARSWPDPPVSTPSTVRAVMRSAPAISARTVPAAPLRAALSPVAPAKRDNAGILGAAFLGTAVAIAVLGVWWSGYLAGAPPDPDPVAPTTTVHALVPSPGPTPIAIPTLTPVFTASVPVQLPSLAAANSAGMSPCYRLTSPKPGTTRAACQRCVGKADPIPHGAAFVMRIFSIDGPKSIPDHATTRRLCALVAGGTGREHCVPYQHYPGAADADRLPLSIDDLLGGRVTFVLRDSPTHAVSLPRPRVFTSIQVTALCEGLLLHINDEIGIETTITVYLDDP